VTAATTQATQTRSPRSRRYVHLLQVRALQLGVLALVVAAWLYAQGPGDVSRVILPELGAVLEAFFAFLASPEVYEALAVTMTEIFVALLAAGVLGFLIGFWGARSELRAGVLEPLLVWGYLVPHVLFYPLLILWFGIGEPSKILYAASSAIFPIAFNCLRAFRRVDPRYVAVGRAYGASPRQMDWLIKLRASIPIAGAGLRIGAALCMVTVVVAEMLASTRGLGYLLKYYAQSFSTAKSYAIILVVLLVVGVFQFVIKRLLPANAETMR
jgi:ABC-type nitrate/sulfonate/bicarbonate transport system permease component